MTAIFNSGMARSNTVTSWPPTFSGTCSATVHPYRLARAATSRRISVSFGESARTLLWRSTLCSHVASILCRAALAMLLGVMSQKRRTQSTNWMPLTSSGVSPSTVVVFHRCSPRLICTSACITAVSGVTARSDTPRWVTVQIASGIRDRRTFGRYAPAALVWPEVVTRVVSAPSTRYGNP